MLKLAQLSITKHIPFQMYLLSNSRVKRLTREFSFYNVKFYREEGAPEHTTVLRYPYGNRFWYVDFKRYVEEEILKTDPQYVEEWNWLLATLKSDITVQYNDFERKLNIPCEDVTRLITKYNLRDYQAYDTAQLCAKMKMIPAVPAGLILSEQRTGKTRVAISTMCEITQDIPEKVCVTIVCPKIAIDGWVEELKAVERALGEPTFFVQVFRHTKQVKTSCISDVKFQVKIISYDLFKLFTYAQLRSALCLKDLKNIVLIADEVHRLRHFNTLQSDMLFRFKYGCLKDGLNLHLIGLTGTPAIKKSEDVFGALSFINTSKISLQDTVKDFNEFKEYFYNCEDTSYGKICRTLKRKNELTYLESSVSVQTKQFELDMFKNYTKQYVRVNLNMTPEQKEIYESVRDSMEYQEDIDCANKLVQLTRLQQICTDPSSLVASYAPLAPKIQWFLKFAKMKSVKTIVMAKKRTALDTLAKTFDKNCIKYGFIAGKVSQTDRRSAIEDFRHGDSQFILIQSDCGKEALTLPEAVCTVFIDRDYAQGYNEQAESRMTPVDGLAHTKYVIDLVMKNTVEEAIYSTLVIRKESIADVNTLSEILKKELKKGGEIV